MSKPAKILNSIRSQDDGAFHLYCYGDIENAQVEYASDYGIVSLTTVVNQLKNAGDAKEIIVHIHSRGGDVNEGFAIHDVLVNSGKKITTLIEGLCASIATVIALAGSTRKMNKNSDFFIHNPWGDPYYMSGFTADDYAQRAEEIRIAENKILDFYISKTGANRDSIAAMMKEQTTLSSDTALELKFITEVVESTSASKNLGVYASLGKQTKTNSEMKNKNKILAAIKAFTKEILGSDEGAIQNLAMTLKDGTAIEVEGSELAVGAAVTVNGDPIGDGSHVLSDDRTIVCAGGKVTEIQAAPEAEDAKPADDTAAQLAAALKDVEALKASVKTLQDAAAENARLSAEAETQINAEMETMKAAFAKAKKTTSDFQPENREFDKSKGQVDEDSNEFRIAKRKAELAEAKNKK